MLESIRRVLAVAALVVEPAVARVAERGEETVVRLLAGSLAVQCEIRMRRLAAERRLPAAVGALGEVVRDIEQCSIAEHAARHVDADRGAHCCSNSAMIPSTVSCVFSGGRCGQRKL